MKAVLKRVLSVMASIPNDKLLHFFYGSIIATPLVIWGSTMEAVGFMIFVSILKEIVDAKMRFSTPNALDALFTFLPVLLLLAVKLVN
ncbi:hypothetical protein N8986_02120 [Flavobacteriaceae bacterium]|nr:hypothetical protein [Flavobacteriaceae bacterium]|tara:strand:+ start:53 stop:316 length:264 start_codon:yes stop_codon:yes gene_type:complete